MSSQNKLYYLLLFYIIGGICLSVCSGVHINRLDVPQLVELGSQESVVLDCEYTIADSEGLVVKWFLNNKSNLVYQWIPPRKPQDVGQFKGRLDLDYVASQNPLQQHRALKILKPGADMSGNYSCVVSTFAAEDGKSKNMMIFTPGKNFQLSHEKTAGSVKLVCLAEDVYPQPIISITSESMQLKDINMEVRPGSDGLFDIVGTVIVKDTDLNDPEKFACEMRVPQANYTAKKETMYYPGVMPTAQLTAAVENALEVQGQGNGSSKIGDTSRRLQLFIAFAYFLIGYIFHCNI